jgi:hypothetical protein
VSDLLQIRMDDARKKTLAELAARDARTMSSLIRHLIDRYERETQQAA